MVETKESEGYILTLIDPEVLEEEKRVKTKNKTKENR